MAARAPSLTRAPLAPGTRSVLFVVAASAAFGTSGPLAKLALVDLGAVTVAAGRCAIAALALLAITRSATVAALRALDGRQRLIIVGAGLVLAAHFALFVGGLGATSFAAAVTLVSLEPIAVLAAALVWFGIVPTGVERIGVLVAAAGAFEVARAGGSSGGDHRLAGDLMVLGAVALYGVYYAAARALRDAIAPLPYATVVYGVAAAALALGGAIGGAHVGALSPRAIAAVLALGVVPTLVGHTLVQIASRTARPAIVALVSPGETIGSVLLGAIWLGLWPSPHELAGGALVVVGATIAIAGARADAPG